MAQVSSQSDTNTLHEVECSLIETEYEVCVKTGFRSAESVTVIEIGVIVDL